WTTVPAPSCDRISNSFERRREPPSPRPSPLPLVNPSLSACSMSAMPGPWSTNRSRRPRRLSTSRRSSSQVPPPPCTSVLRASSLAAVTILVWSTRLNPISTAHARTIWRTRTTSSGFCRGSFSVRTMAIRWFVFRGHRRRRDRRLQHVHGPLDVQRGADAAQRHTQLHERDGDGRTHADDDRLGIEHAGHPGDVAQHAADERVHDLERRDVDEHPPGAVPNDPL